MHLSEYIALKTKEGCVKSMEAARLLAPLVASGNLEATVLLMSLGGDVAGTYNMDKLQAAENQLKKFYHAMTTLPVQPDEEAKIMDIYMLLGRIKVKNTMNKRLR